MKSSSRLPLLSLLLLYFGTILYYRGGMVGRCVGAITFLAIGLFTGTDPEFSVREMLPRHTSQETLAQVAVGLISGSTAYLLYKLGMYCMDFSGGRVAWALPASAIALVVATATGEEVFFRGYIQRRISGAIHPFFAIVLVSLVVAIYKMTITSEGWSWEGAIVIGGVSALGCIWTGLLFHWSGSLVAPIICHVSWDLLVFGNQSARPYWLY